MTRPPSPYSYRDPVPDGRARSSRTRARARVPFGWHGFTFHELVQVPRGPAVPDRWGGGADTPDDERAGDDRRRGQLAAALTGSHAALLIGRQPEPMLAVLWRQADAGGRLRVFAGGRPVFPPAVPLPPTAGPGGGTATRPERPLVFPPGAAALDVPSTDVTGPLDSLAWWVPCAARPDALWTPARQGLDRPAVRRGSFDRLAARLRTPFAWLVLAEPLLADDVQPELDQLAAEILPLSRSEVGEGRRVDLERRQARHRELSRARSGGAWRIRVLVGAGSQAEAVTTAAMLCAAAELDGLPYALAPAGGPAPFADAVAAESDDGDARTPFTAGTELLAAVARPPARELPGLRAVEPHTFDVALEPPGRPGTEADGGLPLGDVVDEAQREVGVLLLNRDSLNRHTFVCGATGSGKSFTVRHLLAEASRAGIPWLVVEPAKAEYDRMANRLAPFGGQVVVIRPGAPEAAPAGFNPLEPASGFPLQSHVDLVRALFLAAFKPDEPFPQILAAALTRCYQELGWDLTLGEPVHGGATPRYPSLADLQRAAVATVDEIGYGKEIADNVRGFITVRIGSLRLGTAGRFFEGGHPIDMAELMSHNVVLQIEDVGDDADKAFFMGAVLLRISEHLRAESQRRREKAAAGTLLDPPVLTHLTVIEEAHRLLRRAEPGTPAAHAVEMFAALLAEVRAYGEGLVIAEQIPSKLTDDVIKNTAVKIVHRLPAKDDRDAVGTTMNVDDAQSRHIVTLGRGHAAVFADGMDRPVLVRVTDGRRAEQADGSRALAPVATIVRRRGDTCGDACHATPCSLREIRRAQHAVSRTWLGLWAETAVVAHMVGMPLPVPTADALADLRAQHRDTRVLSCALSQAVEQAVAARSAVLQPAVGPADLARHVHGALARVLDGGTHDCAADAMHFLATPFRWRLVAAALHDGPAPPDGGRDPRSARWEAEFGRRIPGETHQEQLAAVAGWLAADVDDARRRSAVLHGTARPSVLETALGPAGAALEDRLASALEPFTDIEWLTELLLAFDGGDPTHEEL